MRYFVYINQPNGWTIIVADENDDRVKLYPPERVHECSSNKADWIGYYDMLGESMYEICENQFKKCIVTGVIPENYNEYFVAQRKAKA